MESIHFGVYRKRRTKRCSDSAPFDAWVVEERSIHRRRCLVRDAGGDGSEYADISSDNPG